MSPEAGLISSWFAAWRTRDLSQVELDYLFVDASHFKMRDGARSDPSRCWSPTASPPKATPCSCTWTGFSAESTDACVTFLEDVVARGLSSPVLTISDGPPGLCAALDQVFPHARRQRCLIHRSRNAIAKVAEIDQDAVRDDF